MSKPLIVVLQLIALGMIVWGAAMEPVGVTIIVMGITLVVVAGIAYRRRIKKH